MQSSVVNFEGEVLEEADENEYLKEDRKRDKDFEKDIKRCINKGNQVFGIHKHNFRDYIETHLKNKFYKQCTLTVITYGCEVSKTNNYVE